MSRVLIALALAYALGDGAFAAQRTFVASTGDDAHACSLAAPCRGFAAAILKTDPAGEVIVLDSAGYGAAVITRSVSIIAPPGVYAGISVFVGSGITINGSGIDIVLRGLAINGVGGTEGIEFQTGATLMIERCVVSNFTNNGLRLDSGGAVSVADSAFVSNGGDGISVSAPSLTVQIERTRMEANTANGMRIQAAANVTVVDSVIARNGGGGINIFLGGALTAKLAIDRSTFVDNAFTAVIANAGSSAGAIARLDVTRSTIARNGAGILALASAGATAQVSATNNEVTDNTGNGIAANGGGASVRASGNKVMRNTGGLVQQSSGVVYTPTTNYVRDNTTNDGGHTADARI